MARSRYCWAMVLLLVGCGGAEEAGDWNGPPNGGLPDGGAAWDSGAGFEPLPDDLPPETEERRSFDRPSAGGRYVYVPNPLRDTVAVIDSTTLRIESVDAGKAPKYVAALPGEDTALVLNAGSNDLTIVRTTPGAGSRTKHLPSVVGANAIAIAPDLRHAVVYFDAALGGSGGGSFQDVAVVRLDEGAEASFRVSVGFQPSEVSFSEDGSLGFVITEDGVSILPFASISGPAIARTVRYGDGSGDPESRDVSITADGRYALARREGESSVRRIDLESGEVVVLDCGSLVTDLDLEPSGTHALVVLRQEGAVLRVPLPNGFEDETLVEKIVVDDELVGSTTVSPDGRYAVLYTTAAPVLRATILRLDGSNDLTPVRLRKEVRAVAIDETGHTALIVHAKKAGDPQQEGISLDEQIARSHGYTLLDLENGYPKLQLTAEDVGPVALVPDGSTAFVVFRDLRRKTGDPVRPGLLDVHRVSLASFAVDVVRLGSVPLSIGVLPDVDRVFLGQEHADGRITFVDWQTGNTSLVTGFELNSRIVE